MNELVEIAKQVEYFRKQNCNKCYHGTILEAWYDEDAALDYLVKHNVNPPFGTTTAAFAHTAEIFAKQNGDEGFWRVKQTTCPYKYCKLGE